MKKYHDLILGIIAAVTNAEVRQELETLLDKFPEDVTNFTQTIRQILAGERDSEQLCEPLTSGGAPIVLTILEGLADPSRIAWLSEE